MSFTFRSVRLYPATFLATAWALILFAAVYPGRAEAQKPMQPANRNLPTN